MELIPRLPYCSSYHQSKISSPWLAKEATSHPSNSWLFHLLTMRLNELENHTLEDHSHPLKAWHMLSPWLPHMLQISSTSKPHLIKFWRTDSVFVKDLHVKCFTLGSAEGEVPCSILSSNAVLELCMKIGLPHAKFWMSHAYGIQLLPSNCHSWRSDKLIYHLVV